MQTIKETPLVELISNENAKDLLNKLVVTISKKYELSQEDILNLLKEEKINEKNIPVSVFSLELSALETIVKYLHEEYGLKFSEIGKLLNRDSRAIWNTYHKSLDKFNGKLKIIDTGYVVPVSAFTLRKFGVLEILVHYLKERYHLKFTEIAGILKRNQRTIWTVYHRYKLKEVSDE